MSIENNKAVTRRIAEEIFNRRIMSSFSELMDANIVIHMTSGDFKGYEGFSQMLAPYYAAFPDLQQTIDMEIAEGDKVMIWQTMSGTHKGSLMGIPPTGKKFSIQEVIIERFVDGKAVETWGIADLLGMMQQLGLVPPMAQK
jgi:steroid delta-isomerase-like uncharacterized protein